MREITIPQWLKTDKYPYSIVLQTIVHKYLNKNHIINAIYVFLCCVNKAKIKIYFFTYTFCEIDIDNKENN